MRVKIMIMCSTWVVRGEGSVGRRGEALRRREVEPLVGMSK